MTLPEALKIRDFRILLLTRLCVMLGWITQDVIIEWQVYAITHSVFILGLTGLAEALPALACALFAGHIVDISRPYRVFLACVGCMAFNASILLLVGGQFIAVPGGVLPWLFGGVFISGVARAFTMPASFSLLPQIVPRTIISSASAMLTSSFQFATITAPAITGIVYGGYGVRTAWFMPIMFMGAAFILPLLGISQTPRRWRSDSKREPAAASIAAGWKFIFANRVLLSVMALDMFAVLFGGAVAMLPAFADQVLHVGTRELGLMRAAPAIGAIAVALILAVRPMKTVRGRTLLWMVAGFGVSIILFGVSRYYWLSLLFLAASGGFDSVSMVIRQTLMQWLIPDAMRGRVSSVNSMFIVSSNELGAFESGTAAKLLGLVPSIIAGGIGALVIVAVTALTSPKLRRLVVEAET